MREKGESADLVVAGEFYSRVRPAVIRLLTRSRVLPLLLFPVSDGGNRWQQVAKQAGYRSVGQLL